MKILIVEDDPKINRFICKGLKESGYLILSASLGREAIDFIENDHGIDLVILDLMLPDIDGLEVLSHIRNKNLKLSVLILSAKRSVDDKVLGLQSGADDYLEKPFSFSELEARIQVLLRRSGRETKASKLTYADLEVDLLSRRVVKNSTEIELQAKEYSLLEYLMKNAERPVTKTMILENVYGYNFDTQTNVVDVLVFRLRNKIDKDFPVKLIHTIRGVGYVFKKE